MFTPIDFASWFICYVQLADLFEQYGCFIEGCERKCSTPQKRRMHLIDKHMFPKVRHGICLDESSIGP